MRGSRIEDRGSRSWIETASGNARQVKRRLALLTCCAFLVVQVAGCFSEHAEVTDPIGTGTCPVPVSATGARKAVVMIRGYTFAQDTLRVSAGTTVTWVNCDDLAGTDAHTSTSDAGVWSSPLFAEGATYSRTFTASGTFPYHCLPHTGMRAVVIVQ